VRSGVAGTLLACAACTSPEAPSVSATASASPRAADVLADAAPADAVAEAAAADGGSGADALVGKAAPDFTATAQDGTVVHIAALKGKPVVLYFYPKDETPGCTKEACSFRDSWKAIAATGAVLVGVSADTLDSHRSFVAAHKLPFRLVSDPEGAVGRAYGVPFSMFHKRQTFVIGADGIVRKVYRSVDVSTHAAEILGDLKNAS
jgi:peroxiredoxin Q/BCP